MTLDGSFRQESLKKRRVKTVQGSQRFGVPIGAPIPTGGAPGGKLLSGHMTMMGLGATDGHARVRLHSDGSSTIRIHHVGFKSKHKLTAAEHAKLSKMGAASQRAFLEQLHNQARKKP